MGADLIGEVADPAVEVSEDLGADQAGAEARAENGNMTIVKARFFKHKTR